MLSDNSGYYLISYSTTKTKVVIWKYLLSSPSTTSCQSCSNTSSLNNIQLYLGNNQFYLLTKESTANVDLLMIKFTYASTSVTWSRKLLCPSGPWTASSGKGWLSTDGSLIYNLNLYGTSVFFPVPPQPL